MPPSHKNDLLLIDQYLHRTISDEDFEVLQARLKQEPKLRQKLIRYGQLEAGIQTWSETPLPLQLSEETQTNAWFHGIKQYASLAAALLLGICIGAAFLTPQPMMIDADDPIETVSIQTEKTVAVGAAILRSYSEAEKWPTSQGKRLLQGQSITPGDFSLPAGFAQLELLCGVSIVAEGPARMQLISPWHVSLSEGKFKVNVPPAAQGFQITTKDMKASHQAGEFAFATTEANGTLAKVFSGELTMNPINSSLGQTRLSSGQAMNLNGGKMIKRQLNSELDSFAPMNELADQLNDQATASFERWRKHIQGINQDGRLLVHYSMHKEKPWQRKLINQGRDFLSHHDQIIKSQSMDGAIVGAQKSPGRWPQKFGLSFKQAQDRVRLRIPGKHGSLTMATWVKVDSLDRLYNSLFLTDSYEKGEPHWQILSDGRLFLSVRLTEPGEKKMPHHRYLSPPFWTPALSGKWLHIATVINLEEDHVTHYLNGKMLSREASPADKKIEFTRIGSASLGNWALPNRPDEDYAIRNINGTMDEFALFSAALTEEEIKEMYQNGRP